MRATLAYIFTLFKQLKLKHALYIFALGILTTFIIYNWVGFQVNNDLKHELSELAPVKVGLLLGTAKYNMDNSDNPFYTERIKAIIDLYYSGKIKFILVSGDNKDKSYNEPIKMKNDLLAAGIPENAIYLDYAGFRTYDSVVRSKEVFGQKEIIIVSQKFHSERALYIAKYFGIKAQAYTAPSPEFWTHSKVFIREHLARIKLFIDLYILRNQPTYLGERITIV